MGRFGGEFAQGSGSFSTASQAAHRPTLAVEGALGLSHLEMSGAGGGVCVEIWRGPSGPVALERRASVFSGMLQPIAGRTLDGENPARLDEGATGLRVRDLLPAVGVSRAVYCSWLVCTAD